MQVYIINEVGDEKKLMAAALAELYGRPWIVGARLGYHAKHCSMYINESTTMKELAEKIVTALVAIPHVIHHSTKDGITTDYINSIKIFLKRIGPLNTLSSRGIFVGTVTNMAKTLAVASIIKFDPHAFISYSAQGQQPW